MVATPKQCISFDLSITHVPFRATDPNNDTYSSFYPKLYISGAIIQFLTNGPFPFLGHILYTHSNDSSQRKHIITELHADMTIVDAIHLEGIAKAWWYNHYVVSFIS